MFERFSRNRAPESKPLEKLSHGELVSLTQKGFERELARLNVEPGDKLERLAENNIAFADIPEEKRASGYFAHRANWYGPMWREIVVDQHLVPYQKAKVLVHEALHETSSDEKGGGGVRKYLSTLSRHGYSGLDEGITEHYAQFLAPRIFPQLNEQKTQELSKKYDENNSYAHLVTFVERTLRSVAEKTTGPNETVEDAYARARDFLYNSYLNADHDAVLSFINSNAVAGMGELLAAVHSPRGSKESNSYVSQDESIESLKKTEKLAEAFSNSKKSHNNREPLTVVVNKWYLDPKNYPGYPDHVNDKFVANALYAQHFWSVAEQSIGPNTLTDPCSVELSSKESSQLLGQAEIIREDLDIVEKNFKGVARESQQLRVLRSYLLILGHAQDQGGRKNWEAIMKGVRMEENDPEAKEIKQNAAHALLDLKADLFSLAPLVGTNALNTVFDYLQKRLEGDRDARITLEYPKM